MSNITQPLRDLTKTDSDFLWEESVHGAAFGKIKQMLSQAPILSYYEPALALTLQCDTSEGGLGACILQNDQPIAYASRALTDAEGRYAQIEKEMLAIIFGLERFNQYVYGRPVLVESDHKPLEMIHKKALQAAPKHLQRMLLRAQRYINIVYKKGQHMYIADTLSRAYLQGNDQHEAVEKELEMVHMADYLPISDGRLKEIQHNTESDDTLKTLKDVILQG